MHDDSQVPLKEPLIITHQLKEVLLYLLEGKLTEEEKDELKLVLKGDDCLLDCFLLRFARRGNNGPQSASASEGDELLSCGSTE